jgi:acyl-CoA synthetase (AMP-forming)/AMP-acid ligase II
MNPNDKSVLDSLIHYARIQPSNKVWNFINDAMDVVDSFSYLELEKATTELSKELIDVYKLKEGDRAMLVFFPGLAFTASLLACFKANIIAVPVFPPDPRKLQKDLDHFISIQKSSNAKVALTHKQYNYAKKVTDFTNLFQISKQQTWPTLQWIVVDDILQSGKSKQGIPSSSTGAGTIFDKVAFLQYTSGSTSEPKGVMITHRNLTHNLTLITKELQVDTSTINVAWLPQYHDMGLIGKSNPILVYSYFVFNKILFISCLGSYLGTLYCGGTGYFMSPISFLKDPNIWLKAISKYRGTHTQAPNFAYALATRKFKELLTELSANEVQSSLLDLSCLKHMINAAEPVDLQAVQEFYRTFRTYGLSDNVVVPTYGLAEHTVFVCSDGKTVLYLDKSALENNKVNILQQSLLSDIDTDISKMSGIL